MSKKIFISGAHGSAVSLVKSLAIGKTEIDNTRSTCHESWQLDWTQNKQRIVVNHTWKKDEIKKRWNPDVTIWLKIDSQNVEFICRRIVVLDFLYTNDPTWMERDWCWTPQKHQRLAGPDWPEYSTEISRYPSWCLDEMCQVAWERSRPWMQDRDDFDFVINSDELFGDSPRVSLQRCFENLGLTINHDDINRWKQKNLELFTPFFRMFTWKQNWHAPADWVPAPIDHPR